MSKARPIVAIVGRPNVGKSTLFNRLIGARKAIVEDRPGVTRDRLFGTAEWDGQAFIVVDTGGLELNQPSGSLAAQIRHQVDIAIEEADLLVFVVDASSEYSSLDHEIAAHVRRSSRPILLAANKVDSPKRELLAQSMHELGIGQIYPISAAHGRGVDELCDAIIAHFSSFPQSANNQEILPGDANSTRIAFVGRPNAGKSTMINALLKTPRLVVNEQAGTTHDSVELPFSFAGQKLILIDTAGLRRRKQIARAMEKLAAIKSIRTMERTDVVVLVIDASAGVTDQDQRLARMAFERGKGVVVALHKWDQVAGDKQLAHQRWQACQADLGFLEEARVIKTSVVGRDRDLGQGRARGFEELLQACLETSHSLKRRIPTQELNRELALAVAEHSPPSFGGATVKLLYATQAGISPPLIAISANRGRCLSPDYERYLLRRFRKRWNLRGVPIRIVVRARGRGGSTPTKGTIS